MCMTVCIYVHAYIYIYVYIYSYIYIITYIYILRLTIFHFIFLPQLHKYLLSYHFNISRTLLPSDLYLITFDYILYSIMILLYAIAKPKNK